MEADPGEWADNEELEPEDGGPPDSFESAMATLNLGDYSGPNIWKLG